MTLVTSGFTTGQRSAGKGRLPRARVMTEAPKTAVASDRSVLARQFNLGEAGDTDSDAHSFPLERFALGTTRPEEEIAGDCSGRFLSGFESAVEGSRLNINLDREWVYVYAKPIDVGRAPAALLPLEAEIPFCDIVVSGVRGVRGRATEEGEPVSLTISTRRPARFYSKFKGMSKVRRATERDFVFTVGPAESIPGRCVAEMKAKGFILQEAQAGPIQVVSDDCNALPMSSWLTWQFDMVLDKEALARFQTRLLGLRQITLRNGYDVLARTSPRVRNLPSEPLQFVNVPALLDQHKFEFGVRYLIEGLLSRGICTPSDIPRLLNALENSCSSANRQERVLASLFREDARSDLPALVAERAKLLRAPRLKSEPHQAITYCCTVTPTHVRLSPPEPNTSTDAFRRSGVSADRFLRVQFTDEDGKVFINEGVLDADTACPARGTLARIRRALEFGLIVANRHFEFLAYSDELLRDSSCLFVAPNAEHSVDDIRRALGFDRIRERVPAKHAALMGIPFVQSHILSAAPNIRNVLPDIVAKDTNFTYTQGAGRCGWRIAQHAAESLGLCKKNPHPSAFQFQCGGITGVLSVCPEYDSLDVAFRQSQIGYQTDTHAVKYGMNVLRVSAYRRATFNRHLLSLLQSLGVSERILVERCTQYLDNYSGFTARVEKGLMTANDHIVSKRLSQFPISDLIVADAFNHSQFVLEACRIVQARLLSDLRWDGKLEIKDGVCLMGIPDEWGVLESDEVFCQYDDSDGFSGPTVVHGKCIVMRESALHPDGVHVKEIPASVLCLTSGEIIRVKAVDHPQLRHLKNVIVFPVRGGSEERRPMTEMLSGGTLGGDDYILIWDKELQPSRSVDPVAHKYSYGKMVISVKLEHVKNFLIHFLIKDVSQDLRIAHLAQADLSGPTSVFCLLLASEARVAERFASTGVPAHLPSHLLPDQWPRFMCNDHLSVREGYDSPEFLDTLFSMTSAPSILDLIERRGVSKPTRDTRLERLQIPSSLLDDAYKLKIDYNDALSGIMRSYSVTEAEVVCGAILRGRPVRPGDKETENAMYECYRALAANTLAHVDYFLGKRVFKGKLPPRQIYAIAAYQITNMEKVIQIVEQRLGMTNKAAPAFVPPITPTVMSRQSSTGSTAPSTVTSSPPSTISTLPSTAPSTTGSLNDPKIPTSQPLLISFPWLFWEDLRDLNLRNV